MVSYSHRLQSGHITCYLDRTFDVLLTLVHGPTCRFPLSVLAMLHTTNELINQKECIQVSASQRTKEIPH